MQALLAHLAPRTLPETERLRILRRTLAALPRDHRVLRGLMESPTFKVEIEGSDAGAYDLLLHSQDRPYTVPEVYEWLGGAGMAMRDFSVPRRYDPATYLGGGDASIAPAQAMPFQERHAVAELLHGAMKKHEFYAAPASAPAPPVIASDDPTARPAWTSWKFGEALAVGLRQPGNQLRLTFGEERALALGGDAVTRTLLGAVDGTRDVAGIMDAATRLPDRPSARQVQKRWLEAADGLRAVAALAMHLPA